MGVARLYSTRAPQKRARGSQSSHGPSEAWNDPFAMSTWLMFFTRIDTATCTGLPRRTSARHAPQRRVGGGGRRKAPHPPKRRACGGRRRRASRARQPALDRPPGHGRLARPVHLLVLPRLLLQDACRKEAPLACRAAPDEEGAGGRWSGGVRRPPQRREMLVLWRLKRGPPTPAPRAMRRRLRCPVAGFPLKR